MAEHAQRARERAYAPYSGYRVGAAIEDEKGSVHVGCNVENVSYGATVCAERNAVSAMVAAGGTCIHRLALLTADGGLPCGICLQVLKEFADDFPIDLYAEETLKRTVLLSDLLPLAFDSALVNRT